MMGAATHVRLAAIRSASVTAHFGRLHRLSQGDGVGLVLFIDILAVVVFRLAVLKEQENNIRTAGFSHYSNHPRVKSLFYPSY